MLDFQLKIEAEPSLLSEGLDLEGNRIIHAWFSGTTRPHIASNITLETLRHDPFDYRTMPIEDTFTAAGVTSQLKFTVTINAR